MDAFNLKNVHMSLDDVIKKNKIVKNSFKPQKVDKKFRRDVRKILDKSKKNRPENLVSKSLMLTGLAPTVDQEDLDNLFKSFGAISRLHFREDGKMLGSAEVIAPSFSAAKSIYKQFNQRELDSYPMNIKFTTDFHEHERNDQTNLQVKTQKIFFRENRVLFTILFLTHAI